MEREAVVRPPLFFYYNVIIIWDSVGFCRISLADVEGLHEATDYFGVAGVFALVLA